MTQPEITTYVRCPECGGLGWWTDYDPSGEPEQEQCWMCGQLGDDEVMCIRRAPDAWESPAIDSGAWITESFVPEEVEVAWRLAGKEGVYDLYRRWSEERAA